MHTRLHEHCQRGQTERQEQREVLRTQTAGRKLHSDVFKSPGHVACFVEKRGVKVPGSPTAGCESITVSNTLWWQMASVVAVAIFCIHLLFCRQDLQCLSGGGTCFPSLMLTLRLAHTCGHTDSIH